MTHIFKAETTKERQKREELLGIIPLHPVADCWHYIREIDTVYLKNGTNISRMISGKKQKQVRLVQEDIRAHDCGVLVVTHSGYKYIEPSEILARKEIKIEDEWKTIYDIATAKKLSLYYMVRDHYSDTEAVPVILKQGEQTPYENKAEPIYFYDGLFGYVEINRATRARYEERAKQKRAENEATIQSTKERATRKELFECGIFALLLGVGACALVIFT